MKTQKNKFLDLNKIKVNKLTFDKPGNYTVFFRNLSGDLSFFIEEEKVNLDIYGVYEGKNSDNFQLKTKQYHIGPHSKSNLLIKGVFSDRSKFFYQGLIRIEKTAQGSHAYQKNQNLILSDQSFVDSKPELEILANDVFCTHGVTTGRLNKEQIYYLQTRGLKKTEAEKLLVDGFLNQILCLIPRK